MCYFSENFIYGVVDAMTISHQLHTSSKFYKTIITQKSLLEKSKISIDLLKTNGIFMKDIFCIFNVEL